MKKNLLLVTLLSFILSTSVSAKNVKIGEISDDLNVIQVFALKDKTSILKKKSIFYHYDTFTKEGSDFYRFYVVNVKNEDYLKVLEEIRKRYSSAFRTTIKVQKLHKKKTFINYKMTPNMYQVKSFLDSESILKTRKKFF